MSSNAMSSRRSAGTVSPRGPVPVPATAVPYGIEDPVKKARAELRAALYAIEVKANVPKRLGNATDDVVAQARSYAHRQPVPAAAAAVGVAAAVGAIVWLVARALSK